MATASAAPKRRADEPGVDGEPMCRAAYQGRDRAALASAGALPRCSLSLATLISLVLASLVGATAASPPRTGTACDVAPVARLGSGLARERIEAFFDPTADNALRTYLELRRLVGERQGSVSVVLRVVPAPGGVPDPRRTVTRGWAVSMARHGRLEPALRLLARDGADRVYVRLQTKGSRKELAEEIGLEAAAHDKAWGDSCSARLIRAQDAQLRRRLLENGTSVYRLPVFGVADRIFEDGSSLDKLRPTLGRYAVEDRRRALRPRPLPPETRAVSERLRHPELDGALLGGRGLPHLFVLMARDEDDPNLFMLLPPVLQYRRRFPARLAIRLVARGGTVGAMRLRHRLCAATKLGLVSSYVGLLATEPAIRLADPAAEALLAELDEIPEERCEDEPDPAQMGLPDGGWLDGIPRTRSELDNLAMTLDLVDASRRPLSPLLRRPQNDE